MCAFESHGRLSTAAATVCVSLLLLLGGCRGGATRGERLFAAGLERLALGDSAGCLARLEESRYHAPEDARVLFHLGRLWAARGTIEGRARAERLLRRAVDLQPRVGAYRGVLGELLSRQGFHRESTHELQRAVHLDPSLGRAWFALGCNLQEDWLEEPESTALRDSTCACFQRALAADANDDEARYRLAFLSMVKGDLEHARSLAQPLVYGRDCPGRFGLLMTAIEYRARRFELAQSQLESTLRCLRAADREAIVGIGPLLHPDSLSSWRLHTEAERDSLSEDFWWRQDPTPTTRVNERLVEHVARVVDADFYFQRSRRRRAGHATDRGEIYVRYGPPTEAVRSAEYEFPAWCWNYHDRNGPAASFVFVDAMLNGDYQRLRRGAGDDFMHPELLEALPQASTLQFVAPRGDWRWVWRRFRGRGRDLALEIAYDVPVDSLDRLEVEVAGWRGPRELLGRARAETARRDLFDLGNGHAIGRLRFEVDADSLDLGLQALARGAVDASGGARTRPQWITFGRERVETSRFDPDRLDMSDVMLVHEVRAGSGGAFDMGGVVAVPCVDAPVSNGRLQLYFEVYPPEDARLLRRALAVSYRVQATAPRTWRFRDQFSTQARWQEARPAIEATFTVPSRTRIERQHLTIDVRNLTPGDYTLTVEAQDSAGGTPIGRSVPFSIPKPVATRR